MDRLPLVLVVEDSPDQREAAIDALLPHGFDVAVAVDGHEAIAHSLTFLPDIILMDRGLPLLDGWEAAKQIKSHPRTSCTPVIALTASALIGTVYDAAEAGCDAFLAKPCTIDALLGTIRRLLRYTPQTFDPTPRVGRIVALEERER